MNVITKFGAVAATAVIAAFAAVPSATAATLTTQPGSICRNYNANDASLIDYLTNGVVRSVKTSSTGVICPLVRSTTDSLGAYAYVWLRHFGAVTTSCTLYSHSVFGSTLASDSGSWTGNGPGFLILDVAGAGNSNPYSTYSVYCFIPANANGWIYGVDLNEQ